MFISQAGFSSDSALMDDDFFLMDDEDVYEEGEAYALEDLLQLAEDQAELLEDGDEEDTVLRLATDEDILIWALSLLTESAVARALIAEARIEEWSLEVDDIDSGQCVLDPQLRILILPRFSPSAQTFARSPEAASLFLSEMLRGLRLIWHSMVGIQNSGNLAVEDRILWERLCRGDQDLILLTAAWELDQAEFPTLWHSLIVSDLGDLCSAFRAMADRHPDMVEDSSLLTHLMLRWMEEEGRFEELDHQTLEAMDEEFRRGVASGASRSLKAEDVLRLSRLPTPELSEKCYLAPIARTLLCDPFFRRMPDPLNEAHLLQILEDCLPAAETLGFRDTELARKIFPDHIVNTVV
jgi:hypothetical protein